MQRMVEYIVDYGVNSTPLSGQSLFYKVLYQPACGGFFATIATVKTGWISLHRKIQDNFLWKKGRVFSKAEAWIDILMEVRHSEEQDKVMMGNVIITCDRGQSIKSIETWAMRWTWTRSAVQRFLKLLKQEKMITTENLVKTIRITVCNYKVYQKKRIAPDLDPDRTRTGPDLDPDTDNKGNNANKGKKVKKFVPPTLENVVEYAKNRNSSVDPKKFFEYFDETDWVDSRGTKVRSWKQKFISWESRNGKTGIAKKKTKLFPIPGKVCSTADCRMPAVYKNDSGAYDTFSCSDHLPESVKVKYD